MKFSTIILWLFPSACEGFVAYPALSFAPRRNYDSTCLFSSSTPSKEDLAKQAVSLLESLAASVADKTKLEINKVTGKDEWELGDWVKWVDEQARTAANELTGKEEADLNDLSNWVNGRLKETGAAIWLDSRLKALQANEDVTNLVDKLRELGKSDNIRMQLEAVVGKDTTNKLVMMVEEGDEIQLGELGRAVSNEILELVKNRDYTISDYMLMFKILSAVGMSLNPAILSTFPLNLLLQLYNASLLGEVSSHITGALALEVDKRARKAFQLELEKQTKKAVMGDEDAEIGEFFKKAILELTGLDSYTFGDVTRALQTALEEDKPVEELAIPLDPEVERDAEAFDEALIVEAEVEVVE